MPSRDQENAAEIESAARGAYATITTAAKQRASATGVQQRVGKMVLQFVGGGASRLKNDLRQLVAVPLSLQHSHEALARSLRECSRAVLIEDAEREQFALNALTEQDSDAKVSAALDKRDLNQKARAVLMAALRTDASEEDIGRVQRAIKKLADEDGVPDDSDEERPRPYLMREEK